MAYSVLSFLGFGEPFGVDQNTANEFITGALGLLAIYFRVAATKAISPAVLPTTE